MTDDVLTLIAYLLVANIVVGVLGYIAGMWFG